MKYLPLSVLRGVRAGGIATFVRSTPGVVQDVTGGASAATSGESEAIVVTGARIGRPNLASNSPRTVVSDEEFRYQGATTVESVLNRRPQCTADANENVSNGSDGTSNVNLREDRKSVV